MESYKQEFIEFMVDCQVLKFGDFVTKERKENPVFHQHRFLPHRRAAAQAGRILRQGYRG